MTSAKIFILTCSLFFLSGRIYGSTVTGTVKDAKTGDPLPGAHVVLHTETRTGAAADIRGNFRLTGIPQGTYKLSISYVGYEKKTIEIALSIDEVLELNVELEQKVLEGEEVVVQAQSQGQTAAINQQVSANSVTNVISAQRIQEVPEANAAEAVGRMPGVSLKGSSLVVRGLSPNYNKIQIDGVDMASTSFSDRSSSLGMISQYMLEGVEMTKTAMPDQDADVVGARVNLIIKEAPQQSKFNLLYQNGYHSLSKSLDNQKFVFQGSSRFFDNEFGAFGNVSFETANNQENHLTANYQNITTGLRLANMSLVDDINKMKGRIGATVVLDYKTPITKIKMSSFYSSSADKLTTRSENISNNGNIGHNSSFEEKNQTVITNALRVNQLVSDFEIEGGMSYAFSKNEIPEILSINSTDKNGMDYASVDWQGAPINIPKYANFNPERAFINNIRYNSERTESRKATLDLNVTNRLDLAQWLELKLKIGTKYMHQSKNHDIESKKADMSGYFKTSLAQLAIDIDWLDDDWKKLASTGGTFGFKWFMDPNYSNDNFLLGDYKLQNMVSEERLRAVHVWMVNTKLLAYYKLWKDSYNSDYTGNEDYIAAYVMPEFIVGGSLTIIPGFRYEKNMTNYTGYRLPQVDDDDVWADNSWFANETATKKLQNEYFLPMIHLIYRPLEWFDTRISFTHSLSRPSYRDIIPSWDIGDQTVKWNNPYLKPELSKNWDVLFSFHGSGLGLATIGGFHKTIQNKIFTHGETMILQKDLAQGVFDGLENGVANVAGYLINYEMNNPRPAHVYGMEFEWQSNLWFLPGLLNGLVINVNYTRIYSDAEYPAVKRTLDFNTLKYSYADTFYTDRLLDQTNHIFNLMVGYDYREFSIRGSMKYTDNLFASTNEEPLLRKNTDSRTGYDVSIKQGLPIEGLSIMCNIMNIGQSRYLELMQGNGFPSLERYGGTTISAGVRYTF